MQLVGFRKIDLHVYKSDSLFGISESWEWEPRKMKKMSSRKRFQKYIRWRKVRTMVRFSFPMNRLA